MKAETRFKLTRLLIHILIFVVFILGFSAFLEARTGMVSVLLAYKTDKSSPKSSPRAKVRRTIAEQTYTQKKMGEFIETFYPETLCSYTEQEKPVYEGAFVSSEISKSVDEGDFFKVSFYFENKGNTAWFSDSAPCGGSVFRTRLGTARDQDRPNIFYTNDSDGGNGWIQNNRIAMKEKRVDPGQIATFTFVSQAPFKKDLYREYFQPVIEGKTWFSGKEALAYMDIAVGVDEDEHNEHEDFLWKSGMASVIDLNAPLQIDVDISEQKMRVKKGDIIIREFLVSTGTFKTPTPLGHATIYNKQDLRIAAARPHYRMPNWQGLAFERHRHQFKGVGFHALPYLADDNGVFWNEALNHIGQRVSHGCIRLLPDDAKDLYNLTALGDSVSIHD